MEYEQWPLRLYYVLGKILEPSLIDYSSISLLQRETIKLSNGLVLSRTYYQEYGTTEQAKVVEELITYTSANNLFTSIITTVRWYGVDNVIYKTSTFTKLLLPDESIEFSVNRRRTVLANAKYDTVATIGAAPSFGLLQALQGAISYYEAGYTAPLISAITASVDVLLDTIYTLNPPPITDPITDPLTYTLRARLLSYL